MVISLLFAWFPEFSEVEADAMMTNLDQIAQEVEESPPHTQSMYLSRPAPDDGNVAFS